MSSSLFGALQISRQDMINRTLDLDVTSNNLANMNTIGYKSSRSNFQELLEEQYKEGSRIANTQILTTQGALRKTESPLDWAIEGNGFFQVKLEDGTTGYTREGQFSLDAERNLVTQGGYKLIWDGQIPKDAKEINIFTDGTVQAVLADGKVMKAGTVKLADFPNPSGLEKNGDNIYLECDASGKVKIGTAGTESLGVIGSYCLEQSNTDISGEMTHMVLLQRAFQMSIRAFQQTDTMIQQALNMRKA